MKNSANILIRWYNYVGDIVYKKALEVLIIFAGKGYLAYIVGGYVRDMLLDKESFDIDICTSATPREIMDIFDIEKASDYKYGCVKIVYKGVKFDVATFRKDIKYEDNRKPIKIKYIGDLKKDLLRRDFTINTFCIDKDGNILDVLNVRDDLDNRLIRTIGNPRYKIKEDALRILRAVRFATILDFEIDKKTKEYIIKYGYLLKKLSYNRKKEELLKIFSSSNKEKGRKLLIDLNLWKYLDLINLTDIVMCDDILGIWSQLDDISNYPFSNYEKQQIKIIKKLSKREIDDYDLYCYEPYLCSIAGQINGSDTSNMMKRYDNLIIKSFKDVDISPTCISTILEKEPGKYIKDIMNDVEKKIIFKEIPNIEKNIKKYIIDNYK